MTDEDRSFYELKLRIQAADRELASAQVLSFTQLETLGVSRVDPADQTPEQRAAIMVYHHVHEARKRLAARPDVGRNSPVRPSDLDPAELLAEIVEARAEITRLRQKAVAS